MSSIHLVFSLWPTAAKLSIINKWNNYFSSSAPWKMLVSLADDSTAEATFKDARDEKTSNGSVGPVLLQQQDPYVWALTDELQRIPEIDSFPFIVIEE